MSGDIVKRYAVRMISFKIADDIVRKTLACDRAAASLPTGEGFFVKVTITLV